MMRLQDVAHSIVVEQSNLSEELIHRLLVSISANKNLELTYIKEFEAELFSVNQRKVRYEVLNENIITYQFG